MDAIASHRLRVGYADGQSHALHLQVGRPELQPNGNWVCTVLAEGLPAGRVPAPFYGGSSWQALMVGLRWLHDLLWVEARRGATFYWDGSEFPVRLEELFPFQSTA